MPQRDPAKERYWRGLLRLWRQSGLTGQDFCVEHRVSQASFYAWRLEIARRDREKLATARKRTAPARSRQARSLSSRRSSGTATPAFLQLPVGVGAATASAIQLLLGEHR